MPTVHDAPLPYVDRLPERPAAQVTLVVIHCTELPDLATAREYGEQVRYESGTGNSGHYYIDRDGTIHRYVPGTRIAHHVRGRNADSLGIELVNRGRFPHWYDSRHQDMDEPYTAAQIDALRALLTQLRNEFPHLAAIAGHEDLDTATVGASDDPGHQVARKRDPGPLFPWAAVLDGSGLRREGGPPSSGHRLAAHPPLGWPGIAPDQALILPLEAGWLRTPFGETCTLEGVGLRRKNEFHVTVLDRRQATAAVAGMRPEELQALFEQQPWTPRRTGRYALLHRPAGVDRPEAWSLVEHLELPALLAFRAALARRLGPALADPVPHVTHFVAGDPGGIGLADGQALRQRERQAYLLPDVAG